MTAPRVDPPLPFRVLIALGSGLLAGTIVWIGWGLISDAAADWDQAWHGARLLLAGADPYRDLTPAVSPWPLIYPLPAVLLALPVAWLPLEVARATWFGATTAVLAFAWARPPWWRLAGLLSGAFAWCALGANWTPLLLAGLWLPAVSALWSIKPTTGVLLWLRRPARLPIAAGVILAVLALVVEPGWVAGWLRNIFRPAWGYAFHPSPATLPAGWLLLLVLVRWRRPDAHLLAGWALVPSSVMPSELLLGYAVARSKLEWGAVTLASWLVAWYGVHVGRVYPGGAAGGPDAFAQWARDLWPALLAAQMLPVLMVLRRPNVRDTE